MSSATPRIPFPSLLTLLAAALLLAPIGTAHAVAQIEEAQARLRTAVDAILQIATRTTNRNTLVEEIRPILMDNMCFEAMTRRAVGPGWRELSPEQRRDAQVWFATLLIRKYSERINPGELPHVEFRQATSPAPNRAEIITRTSYKGSSYEVIYRMEKSTQWRVTDVIIEGMSLVANYRSQFDSIFRRGGTPAVLQALQQSAARPL